MKTTGTNIDRIYQGLVRTILTEGTRKENRTGVDTISTFGLHYSYDLVHGFPLLTTKQISWKNILVEMLWFLSGQTDISILKRHGCKFWDAWADEEGRVPSAYGAYWRRFPTHTERKIPHANEYLDVIGPPITHREVAFNDQIRWAIEELKRNPMSRRVVVSAWAPGKAQTSKLPPCHVLFVFNVQLAEDGRKRLCLHLTQRSCDVALGIPYNIASYALLLHLVARFTGLEPGVFSHTLIDAHAYTCKPDGSMAEYDHVPGLEEQSNRIPTASPFLAIHPSIQSIEDVEALMQEDVGTATVLDKFSLYNYHPHPAISFKVAV